MSKIVDGNLKLVTLMKVLEIILDFYIIRKRRPIISDRKTMLEITIIKASSMFL